MFETYCEQPACAPDEERNGTSSAAPATKALPVVEVLGCYFDDQLISHPAAMSLRWHPETLASASRIWHFPGGIRLAGSFPEAFGISIKRWGLDAYTVCLLWNHTFLNWATVTRDQLLDSALPPILQAIGTDLWYLLDQPIDPEARFAEMPS